MPTQSFMDPYAPQSQSVGGQRHRQRDHNENPNQPMTADAPLQDYSAGLNHPGYQHNKVMTPTIGFMQPDVPPAGPFVLPFPNPAVAYPVAPSHGPQMNNHIMYSPTNYVLGPYTPGTTAGPSSLAHWPPSTYADPTQIPTPEFSYLRSAGATNTFSPNAQEPTGRVFQQQPLPVAPNQVPLFPQLGSRYTTDNTMGLPYSINDPAASSRTQQLPPCSRPDRIPDPDPEVHEAYQDLHLQAVLKGPKNQQPTAPVIIRRERMVVLELALHSRSHPISHRGWGGILLPQTRSVQPGQQAYSGKLLKFSIQVLACTTGVGNAQPCNSCWQRERQTIEHNLQPYMIDFKAESNITTLSIPLSGNDYCLKADVTFHFTCYSHHHGGVYELILKLHDESGNLVAQRPLQYNFIVTANGTGSTTARQRTLRPVFPVPNPPPAPVSETRSPVLPINLHPVFVNQHSQLNPNFSASILQRLAPAEGPVSGGLNILLSGTNFPTHPYQLYARFGTVVVPTIWHNPHTLECRLPPSPTPGSVRVTLSLSHEPGGSEFGQSHCWFKYNQEHDYFYALLRAISGQEHTLTPGTWDAMIPHFLQNVSTAGRDYLHQATRPAQPMNLSFSIGAAEMEGWTVQLLASFANSPSWENTVSLVNEHRQTLAHLAVLYRYTTLLDRVAQWGINVDVQDVNGFTALHCAYLCGDLESVRILQGYGADEDIQDCLGRRPVDMYIPKEKGSPWSGRTPSAAQMPEDWENLSNASSSFSDYVTTMPTPAIRHQQLHAGESTTSSRIVPAAISMPSPTYGNPLTTDEGWIDGSSGLNLSDSPTALERSPVSTHLPNGPVDHLCSPHSESRLPAEARQGMPARPQSCGHSHYSTPSSNPPPRLLVSEARALPSRGPEATSSQGGVRSDDSSPTSPPLFLIAPRSMPLPTLSQHDAPACWSPSLLDPRTAHSSSPAASGHHINPCPGTKAELNNQPVPRPSSAGPPTTKRFDPPPHPPPAVSGSGVTPAYSSAYPDTKLPPYPYEEAPQKFSDDKKQLLSDYINESQGSRGGPVKLSTEKETVRFLVQKLEKLALKEVPGDEKRRSFDGQQDYRLPDVRHGNT